VEIPLSNWASRPKTWVLRAAPKDAPKGNSPRAKRQDCLATQTGKSSPAGRLAAGSNWPGASLAASQLDAARRS